LAVIGAALVWSGHGIASHMQSVASASLPETLGLSEAEATADFKTATQTFHIVNQDGWYLVTKKIHDSVGRTLGHKATCVQEQPLDADEAWVTSRETVSTGVATVIKPAMDPNICLCEEGEGDDDYDLGGASTSTCADAKLTIQYDGKFMFASHGMDEESDREKLHAVCCDDQGVKMMNQNSILHEDSMCIWGSKPIIGSLARDSWTFKARQEQWAGKK